MRTLLYILTCKFKLLILILFPLQSAVQLGQKNFHGSSTDMNPRVAKGVLGTLRHELSTPDSFSTQVSTLRFQDGNLGTHKYCFQCLAPQINYGRPIRAHGFEWFFIHYKSRKNRKSIFEYVKKNPTELKSTHRNE